MKTPLKCLALGVGLCLAGGQLHAAQTNLVQTLNFRGILYYQGATETNSTATTITKSSIKSAFNNRSLINRFGQLASVTFSTAAKLLLVTELDSGDVYVIVKDGTNRLDVTSYFDVDFDNDPVVDVSTQTISSGALSATRLQLMDLRLKDVGDYGSFGMHFNLDGLATVKRKTMPVSSTLYLVERPAGKLAGKGSSDNVGGGQSDFLAAITFSVTGGTVEVLP